MLRADLTFNVVEGRLTGRIGKLFIDAAAGSGGRWGSKTPGAYRYFLANNVFSSAVRFNKRIPGSVGGTIPLGVYRLRSHESVKGKEVTEIRLLPDRSDHLHGRGGFLIHGRGPIGSEGCIVLVDFNVVRELYRALKEREREGKPAPRLEVVAIGADPDFKLRQFLRTA
jgi:hypothetical protein